MTKSNTGIPILDDDAIEEIESRLKDWDGGAQHPASWNNVRALCQTVRALRAENERLKEELEDAYVQDCPACGAGAT